MTGCSRSGVGIVAVVLVSVVVLASPLRATAVPIAAPLAGQQTVTGLKYESHSTYQLDVPGRAVHVRVDATLTNTQPDQVVGGGIRQYYFPRFGFPIAVEATNLDAERDGAGAQHVSIESGAGEQVGLGVVTLAPALYYGNSVHVVVTYDLPAQPPRSPGATRVNDAFASFLLFAVGDPGLTTVSVSVPKTFTTDFAGATLRRTDDGDQAIFTADVDDALGFGVGVTARDDSKLVKRVERVDGRQFTIEAWPEDATWSDFIATKVHDGLPVLERLIGQTIPVSISVVDVIETSSPYLYGYAGWFDPDSRTIEVGDELDPAVILHELSHMWFKRDVFRDRWIDEGFAQEYASRALEQLQLGRPDPTPVDPAAPGALRLNSWGNPQFQDENTGAQEDFGYNASWSVIRSIVDEIGLDNMKAVIAAAITKTMAYVGHPTPERFVGATDWERFLDDLDNAGSEIADGLFASTVATDVDQSRMLQRAAARQQYQSLVDAGTGWTPPYVVRQAMSNWDFTTAGVAMTQARAVLDERDTLTQRLRGFHVQFPPALQSAYEGALDLGSIKTQLDGENHAADAVASARAARDQQSGLWSSFGLFGGRVDHLIASSTGALARGDVVAAAQTADRARHLADHADDEARRRVLVIVILAAVVALLLVALRRLVARAPTT